MPSIRLPVNADARARSSKIAELVTQGGYDTTEEHERRSSDAVRITGQLTLDVTLTDEQVSAIEEHYPPRQPTGF